MKKIISLLLITMIIVTACTSQFKVDEDKVKNVSDIVTDAIIKTVGEEKSEKSESHTIVSDKNTINIINSVGDISVALHESDKTVVNININTKAGSKERAEEAIENYTYTIEEVNDMIVIDTSFENIKDVNLNTDLVIYIPPNIEYIKTSSNVGNTHINGVSGNFQIYNNVGEIIIDSSKGSYNLKTDVGDIVLTDCIMVRDSELIANTGSIDIFLNDMTNANNITAEAGVGDIEISCDKHSGYHAVIKEFMKDERIETSKEQSTKIHLTSGVGGIDFNM